MKRMITLALLSITIFGSAPIAKSAARFLTAQESLEEYCRASLGFSPNDFLDTTGVTMVRRCLNNLRKKEEEDMLMESRMQRYEEQFWKRYDIGQEILRESRRSLHKRMENQERIRKAYYKEVPLEKRSDDLLRHRRARREAARLQQQQVVIEQIWKVELWRDALFSCGHLRFPDRNLCIAQMLRN